MAVQSSSNQLRDSSVDKYAYIDALRGIAILGVLLVHSGARVDLPAGLVRDFIRESRFGVQLFYMISAFTLYHSLDARSEKNYRDYFVRRFFRIWPLYSIAALTYAGYTIWAHAGEVVWADNYHLTWVDTITNLALLHGFIPKAINSVVPGGWSIGVEWIFYLMLPLIYRCVRNLSSALLATGLAIGFSQLAHFPVAHWLEATGTTAGIVIGQSQISAFLGYYIVRQLPSFLFGVATYYIFFPQQGRGERTWLSACALGYWIFMLGCYFFDWGVYARAAIAHEFEVCVLYIALFAAMKLVSERSWGLRLLASLGKLSYSLYLTHFMVLLMLGPIVAQYLESNSGPYVSVAGIYGGCLLVSVAISMATFRWIEQPGMRVGKAVVAGLKRR